MGVGGSSTPCPHVGSAPDDVTSCLDHRKRACRYYEKSSIPPQNTGNKTFTRTWSFHDCLRQHPHRERDREREREEGRAEMSTAFIVSCVNHYHGIHQNFPVFLFLRSKHPFLVISYVFPFLCFTITHSSYFCVISCSCVLDSCVSNRPLVKLCSQFFPDDI